MHIKLELEILKGREYFGNIGLGYSIRPNNNRDPTEVLGC
jgi:hypothetical protein